MFNWLLKKLLGASKKQIQKAITESSTTRTVAEASVSTLAICRVICAFLAELGLIPSEMMEDTALVISAVLIPLLSRLLAIIRSKLS